MKLYNTLTRKRQEFKPIKKGHVGLYCCGPTVYWHQHIGNLRTYIFEDVLVRVLKYIGYKVKHIINVTDVGHLTSDADVGEDKLIKAIKREGLPLTLESMHKLANIYFEGFKEDFKKLNINEPDVWCKATDHVQEMIDLIKKIEKNGYAYKTSVGLVYDTAKFKDYTKLGKLNLEQQEEGARGKKDSERKSPSDFALWLTNQPNHIMMWDSEWGKGFPGWHIECCAMSIKYLGEQFDIHCGGKEHIPIHHTNEIAQAEAATGKKPWVNYWLHAEWLEVPDGKMSKSKGSFTTVSDLAEKGYDPLVYRYFCFNAHYRTPLTFSWEALDNAKNAYNNLKNKVIEIKNNQDSKLNKKKTDEYKKQFNDAITDDLNMPEALSLLWSVVKDNELGNKEKYELLLDFDSVFGLGFKDWKKTEVKVSDEVKELVKKREQARNDKDWKLADELRDKIKSKGYTVEDTSEGSVVKEIR